MKKRRGWPAFAGHDTGGSGAAEESIIWAVGIIRHLRGLLILVRHSCGSFIASINESHNDAVR
jgi:hypothetical protein